MGSITLTVGAITETRSMTPDNKFLTMVKAYLGDDAWRNVPDPQTGELVKTPLTNAGMADLFMDMLSRHVEQTARENHKRIKAREAAEAAHQEAEAITWQ